MKASHAKSGSQTSPRLHIDDQNLVKKKVSPFVLSDHTLLTHGKVAQRMVPDFTWTSETRAMVLKWQSLMQSKDNSPILKRVPSEFSLAVRESLNEVEKTHPHITNRTMVK